MVSKSFQVILILVLAAWLWGCSAIVPERKTPSGGSKILEEDVTGDRATQPNVGDEAPPGVGESLPSAEGAPPGVQPEHRSPRRIKWRDQKGSTKGWESSTEGTPGREP
ncbi:MAG: hypothetical protein ACLP5H_02320 [Desulfomonilaceae bacterium]